MDTRSPLHGITPNLVVPFVPEGEEIDFRALEDCIAYAEARGFASICVPGYLSDYQKLTDSECAAIIDAAVRQVGGRIAIVAPVHHPSARVAAETARNYQERGADVIAFSIPRTVPLSNDDVVRYAETICRAVTLPILVQDRNPTGPTVGVDFCQPLMERCANFRWLQLQEPLMMFVAAKITAIRRATDDRLGILEGWNGLYALELKPYGIVGAMPALGVADVFQSIWEQLARDESARAQDVFQAVLPRLTFALQHMDLFLDMERRLLIKRGLLTSAAARSASFSADPQILARGEWLNQRVMEQKT